MSFNKHDLTRNEFMIKKQGYDWWWHSFSAIDDITKEEKAFFIEYFLINPSLSKDIPVFGKLPENKANHIKPSYLMVKGGTWGSDAKQLHRFFAWKDVSVKANAPFSIKADDCIVCDKKLAGSIEVSKEDSINNPALMCDSGSMSWDLTVDKMITFNVGYGTSKPIRTLNVFEMAWHAEGMKSQYSGTVIYNGKKYNVIKDKSFGYADKNWGKGFTSPWVWLSSNNLKSNITGKTLNNSVFDIGGGCPKILNISLERKLLSAFYYEGREFEFNFSKFWTHTKTIFDCKIIDDEMVWNINQQSTDGKIEVLLKCKVSDMLFVNYEAPDGSKKHNKLYNGGNGYGTIKLYEKKKGKYNIVDDIDVKNLGCEYGEYSK